MIRLRWVLVAAVAWAVSIVVLDALPPRSASRLVADCVVWAAIGLVLWQQAERRARREPDGQVGWRCLGLAGLLLAVTSTADGTLTAVYGRLPLPEAVVAVMDNGSWLLLLAGLFAWSGRGRRRVAASRAALDGMLLAAACFLLAWWAGGSRLALNPDVSVLRAVRSVAPFAMTCTSLGIVSYLVARSVDRLRGPLGWIGAGHLGMLVGGLAYAWATMLGAFYPGHIVDSLTQVPLCLFALSASSPAPLPLPIAEEDPGSGLGDLLTILPACVALCVGMIRYFAGIPADGVTEVCGAAVIALLIFRQFLAIRDVRKLSETLERRVDERTRALEESQRALVQSQRMEAVGRMAGSVAHDFNNILTAIIGYLELLRADLAAGDRPQADADADAIEEAVGSGTAMARRLLTFAKPQAATPRAIKAAEAVARARQVARGLARGRVEVVDRVAPDAGAVHMDPVMLEQVLTNLAINAIDAMPEGGVLTLEASAVDVTATRGGVGPAAGSYVRFAVSDTGGGIDESAMGRIFEPFFTTKHSTRGTGAVDVLRDRVAGGGEDRGGESGRRGDSL